MEMQKQNKKKTIVIVSWHNPTHRLINYISDLMMIITSSKDILEIIRREIGQLITQTKI